MARHSAATQKQDAKPVKIKFKKEKEKASADVHKLSLDFLTVAGGQ